MPRTWGYAKGGDWLGGFLPQIHFRFDSDRPTEEAVEALRIMCAKELPVVHNIRQLPGGSWTRRDHRNAKYQ